MIIELEITKENTYLVADNEDSQYIIGIGETDYTIHREADHLSRIYIDRHGYFNGWSLANKHNYHVFRQHVRSIVDDIVWKNEINYKGTSYRVVDAYLGVNGRCRAVVPSGYGYQSLRFEGEELSSVNQEIKYILEVSENESKM